MSARSLTPLAQVQNARFLAALADTGNARLAARSLGLNRSTFTKRRARHAAFATAWDGALAAAHARFHLGGGPRIPETKKGRTNGGEPTIVRRAGGRLQLRLALPGQITRAGEQAFLRALSASANVRLSAAAAGLSHSTIYKRKNGSDAFRREMKHALDVGYDRLALATLALFNDASNKAWIEDLPVMPPMSFAEALQLLALHRNEVKLGWDAPHRRKRRNETHDQHCMRLQLMWKAEQRNLHKERAVKRGKAYEETGDWRLEGDWAEVAELPDLSTVTGWSGKKPATKKAEGGGLFGGWTIEDLERRRAGEGG